MNSQITHILLIIPLRLSAFCRRAHFAFSPKYFFKKFLKTNVHFEVRRFEGLRKGTFQQRQLREVTFSDLSPLEENQLYVCDKYFADDEAEQSFVVGGKEITAKLLAEALHSLPEEKRETVLLYYFFDMSEREIAKFCNLSRTTVQSRRTSSMKLLKRYLEERAYDCTD